MMSTCKWNVLLSTAVRWTIYSISDSNRMNMEHCWNDNDTQKQKYLEKSLPQCHLAHHKSYM